jgi:hypothetical protein
MLRPPPNKLTFEKTAVLEEAGTQAEGFSPLPFLFAKNANRFSKER